MKTKFVLALFVFALLVLNGCSKETNKISNSNSDLQKKKKELRPIQQKDIWLDPRQTTARIMKFRAGLNSAAHKDANLVEADSIALDSSIYVVEAALNYEFDFLRDSTYEIEVDTSEFTIPIDAANQRVSSEELEGAYNQLRIFVNEKVNENVKVALVDVEAFYSGPSQITYRSITSYFWMNKLVYCWYLTSNYYSADFAFYQNNMGCTPSDPDAVTELAGKINCIDYWCMEGLGYYYTNVTSPTFFPGLGGAYSSAVWEVPANTLSYHCANKVTLSQATLYSKIAGCYSLTNSNAPAGKTTAMRGLQVVYYTAPNTNPSQSGFYLNLYATYATRICASWPRE